MTGPRLVAGVLLTVALTSTATVRAAGDALWFDLSSEDADAAKAFYTALLGWRFEPEVEGLALARLGDEAIAGVIAIADSRPGVVESYWLLALTVDDVERTVRKATTLGAELRRGPAEVSAHGRYAVIVDPQGAALTLRRERRSGAPGRVGDWLWTELWTTDVDGAAAFYRAVLGFERQSLELPSGPAEVLTGDDGERRAALVRAPPGVAPSFVPFVLVDDVTATARLAEELGGEVLLPPDEKLGGGRVALVADPTGAAFFVEERPSTPGP